VPEDHFCQVTQAPQAQDDLTSLRIINSISDMRRSNSAIMDSTELRRGRDNSVASRTSIAPRNNERSGPQCMLQLFSAKGILKNEFRNFVETLARRAFFSCR
jgi:hypothetical protein